jgi:hypothetical protein
MLEDSGLVIPLGLVIRIDLDRGDMDRLKFGDQRVRAMAQGEKPSVERESYAAEPERAKTTPERVEEGQYITVEEFEEFKRSIKELQGDFIDFFVSYGLELSEKALPEEQERLRQQMKRLLEL